MLILILIGMYRSRTMLAKIVDSTLDCDFLGFTVDL
jgi:hypothetical protein